MTEVPKLQFSDAEAGDLPMEARPVYGVPAAVTFLAPEAELDISDIVKIDENGRGHRPDGKFLSPVELASILAHRQDIRLGMMDLPVEAEPSERIIDGDVLTTAGEAALAGSAREEATDEGLEDAIRLRGLALYAQARRPKVEEGHVGRHRLEDSQAGRPDTISPEMWARFWARLDDEQRRMLVPSVSINEAEVAEPAESSEVVPVETETKRRLGMVAWLGAAPVWLGYKAHQVKEYFADPEKGRQRKIVAIVAGAAVLTSAALWAYWALRGPGLMHHPTPPEKPPGTGIGPIPGPGGGGVKPVHESLGYPGDTIWDETRSFASQYGVTLSERDKQDIVGDILKSNHQSWLRARHLPVGYQFTINQSEVNEILAARG